MISLEENKIDIRPATSVYGTYRRLSYKPWYALAEFIDNSTQSYYDHKEVLTGLSSFNKLVISINYDPDLGVLEITDNAYGMNFEDFQRALILDKPPKMTAGRNEFGMGLKTAACWFGNKWTVETTTYGSSKLYRATINVKELEIDKTENVIYEVENVSHEIHKTKITIEDLNQKPQRKSIGKMKSLLASIYRVDLRRGDIVIIWNGDNLSYPNVDILEEELDDGTKKKWKEELEFEVESPTGELFNVSGWIGIRAKGDASAAGLVLIRRGRVIVGGDVNYKPEEVFGKGNSFESQRLFGELNMDNWPVTQAKDGFDWYNGLEERFIAKLEQVTAEYAYKARTYRVNEAKKVNELTENQKTEIISTTVENISNAVEAINNPTYQDQLEIIDVVPIEKIKSEKIYTFEVENYAINVKWNDDDEYGTWLIVEDRESEIDVMLNIRHKFFVPFIHQIEFLTLINQFAVAMVIAEKKAKSITTDENKKIDPWAIRIQMNKLLEVLAKQE